MEVILHQQFPLHHNKRLVTRFKCPLNFDIFVYNASSPGWTHETHTGYIILNSIIRKKNKKTRGLLTPETEKKLVCIWIDVAVILPVPLYSIWLGCLSNLLQQIHTTAHLRPWRAQLESSMPGPRNSGFRMAKGVAERPTLPIFFFMDVAWSPPSLHSQKRKAMHHYSLKVRRV